jgi:acetyl-CoA carboxylase carboxyl transferase subunit alpha
MASDTLDFEEPVAVLLKEIEAMRMMPQTPDRLVSIARLEKRVKEMRAEIYANLGSWQRVQVARHPNRPCMLDYVERVFTGFTELHGDRRFADDTAIVTGFAFYHDRPVVVVGHQKGRDTKQKIYRNFGYARPEGYRKALRVMRLAEKFGRPVIVFVDTPAAYPGIESEERGVAEAIALNLREMAMLEVPIIVIVCGEGGSGGALGIAVGDRVLMQEFSVYSVIPPEGCAAILWRDAQRKVEAAEALKITAPDLLRLGLIDEIVKEPEGGAHLDYDRAAVLVDGALARHLQQIEALPLAERLDGRYRKFRAMGSVGQAYVEEPQTRSRDTAPVEAATTADATGES